MVVSRRAGNKPKVNVQDPVRLRWDEKGLDRVDAAFVAGDLSVRATFELGDHAWHASFRVKSDSAQDTISLAKEAFVGVFQAVWEFVTVREPQVLVFVTDRPELAQLYRTQLLRDQMRLEAMGYSLDSRSLTLRRSAT